MRATLINYQGTLKINRQLTFQIKLRQNTCIEILYDIDKMQYKPNMS